MTRTVLITLQTLTPTECFVGSGMPDEDGIPGVLLEDLVQAKRREELGYRFVFGRAEAFPDNLTTSYRSECTTNIEAARGEVLAALAAQLAKLPWEQV